MPRDNPESITRVHYSGPEGTILSAIHNPQSTIHNPQSTIHNLQSTINNPRCISVINNPQSTMCKCTVICMALKVNQWWLSSSRSTATRSDCTSLLRPLRRSHGLCVLIPCWEVVRKLHELMHSQNPWPYSFPTIPQQGPQSLGIGTQSPWLLCRCLRSDAQSESSCSAFISTTARQSSLVHFRCVTVHALSRAHHGSWIVDHINAQCGL